MRFNTRLLHLGNAPDMTGATLPAVYQVSAFAHESAQKLEEIFTNRAAGFSYTRIANPTVAAFEQRMAAIEGGVAAVACASGMAAVSMALLNLLQSGDEIIAGAGLFGGTLDLLRDLEAFGIRTRFVERVTAAQVEAAINEKTRVIFAELIENPKLNVMDVPEIAGIAAAYNIPLIIDSTTATPALIRPLELGAHIVVHSSSKYINGNGGAISGVIVDGGKFDWDFERFPVLARYREAGKLAYTARLRQDIWRNFGVCLAPENAYLNCLGLETLGLRMERLCANAKGLAAALENNPALREVRYPGLESSLCKALVDRQMEGGLGGAILTLRVGSRARAFELINNLKYVRIATNLGDVRTLVIHPASTIYARSSEEQKRSAGVFDDLIRVSVGLEDLEDLIEDFTRAITKMTESEA